ncbi:DMT family transporter [Dongia sp.]|uniref:DMT family transporter n=1 Tax=Dongia sp. TaxID=1977262 RepID=UPI0035B3ABB4
MQNSYRLGLILTTCSAIAWSTSGFFTTWLGLDNWSLLLWRGIFGAFGILAFMAMRGGHAAWGDLRRLGVPGWLYAAISGIGMLCFITALTLTSVAHVAIIYGTAPFIAAATGWLVLRIRPGKAAMIAAGVAFIGVVIMVVPGLSSGAGLIGIGLWGDLLAFGMTLCLALMMIVAKRFDGIPTLAAAALSAALSALVALPFAGDPALYSAPVWAMFVLFGLVNSALGLVLFTLGARLLPPVETALIGALDAPLAPVWVWIAFGIMPDSYTMIGGLLVFGAVTAHILRSRRQAV